MMRALSPRLQEECRICVERSVDALLYHTVEGDNTRVGRGNLVQSNFVNVYLPLMSSAV